MFAHTALLVDDFLNEQSGVAASSEMKRSLCSIMETIEQRSGVYSDLDNAGTTVGGVVPELELAELGTRGPESDRMTDGVVDTKEHVPKISMRYMRTRSLSGDMSSWV